MVAEGLIEFLAVARAGSFTAAAHQLGCSVAHTSRKVARLEKRLETRLFTRSTRSVLLTPEGEVLNARAKLIADQLEEAFQDVSSPERALTGCVRIASLTGSFADSVVTPAVMSVAKSNPELEITVDYEARNIDIIREGYDLSIRAGPLRDSALIARPLARRRFVAAAAPAYLETYGEPKSPSDLHNHCCILVRGDTWEFQENETSVVVPVSGKLRFNAGPAIAQACREGLGIAYMASSGFGDMFRTGEVRKVLERHWRTEISVFVVRAHRDFVPARLRVIIDALEAAAAAYESKVEYDLGL